MTSVFDNTSSDQGSASYALDRHFELRLAGRDAGIKKISSELSHLREAWGYSVGVLKEVRSHVKSGMINDVATIIVAGSVGRMEAGSHSDFDYFVIARNNKISSRDDEKRIGDAIWKKLKNLDLVPPDENGIFRRVVTQSVLCDHKAYGNLDYARHVFGLRIQLLTDCQPVYAEEEFIELQREIIRWYCEPGRSPLAFSPLQYLLSDLKRYYHSYSVWHQYRFDKTYNDSWLMRQVKMNHSRLTSYLSLVVCLIELSVQGGDHGEQSLDENGFIEALVNDLMLTPVERLVHRWPAGLDIELMEYLDHYNWVTGVISDDTYREVLIESDPVKIAAGGRYVADSHHDDVIGELVERLTRIRELLALCMHRKTVDHRSTSMWLF